MILVVGTLAKRGFLQNSLLGDGYKYLVNICGLSTLLLELSSLGVVG